MISTLNGWSRSTMNARASAGVISLSSNGWSAAMLSRIRASIDRQVVRGQRARQQQVVVEAVVDDRADPELGAREEVHHRLGEDVGGRMAHRAELAARAVVHQLGGRAALGRVEADLDRLLHRRRARPVPGSSVRLLENHETPRPSTGREASSRGPTRLRHQRWRTRGRAIGRLPGRFAGRSRVVPVRRRSSGFQPRPGSLGIRSERCVPIDALLVGPRPGCGGRHWTRTSDLLHVKQVL